MKKKMRKRILILSAVLILMPVMTIILSRSLILQCAEGKIYSDPQSIPKTRVGLVLGCCRMLPNGRENLYFRYRIQAAQELYHRQKIEYILVSGDNHIQEYDEPSAMKQALEEAGVPEDKIFCDYAGFSTLDSIIRAHRVFMEDRIVVISQPFHNQRAIFIGTQRGIDVIGYNAKDVQGALSLKTRCREQLARVKAVLDVYLLNRKPHFLGRPILIGSNIAQEDPLPAKKDPSE